MEYQSEFLRVILLNRACCSRVTHPCAGRHQFVLLQIVLPLDLHVLSLPLAFILSQDQTLHCIFFYINFQLVLNFMFVLNFSKEINACTLFLVLINCTCSSLFQSTFALISKAGAKISGLILISKFLLKILHFFFKNTPFSRREPLFQPTFNL